MPEIAYRPLHFKAASMDDQGIFEGHASVWDIVDSEGDVVERGAFARTISEGAAKDGIPILALHDDTMLPIGRTLELREDDVGLYIKGHISPTSMGNDVRILIRDGVLDELSIGYIVVRYVMMDSIRHLQELELPEISVVTWAANSAAKITGYKGGTAMAASQIQTDPTAQVQGQGTKPGGTEAAKTTDQLLAEGRELIAQLHALGVEIPKEETDMYEIGEEE